MTSKEVSPDMIWYDCYDCERNFTLADMGDTPGCAHCGSRNYGHYTDG